MKSLLTQAVFIGLLTSLSMTALGGGGSGGGGNGVAIEYEKLRDSHIVDIIGRARELAPFFIRFYQNKYAPPTWSDDTVLRSGFMTDEDYEHAKLMMKELTKDQFYEKLNYVIDKTPIRLKIHDACELNSTPHEASYSNGEICISASEVLNRKGGKADKLNYQDGLEILMGIYIHEIFHAMVDDTSEPLIELSHETIKKFQALLVTLSSYSFDLNEQKLIYKGFYEYKKYLEMLYLHFQESLANKSQLQCSLISNITNHFVSLTIPSFSPYFEVMSDNQRGKIFEVRARLKNVEYAICGNNSYVNDFKFYKNKEKAPISVITSNYFGYFEHNINTILDGRYIPNMASWTLQNINRELESVTQFYSEFLHTDFGNYYNNLDKMSYFFSEAIADEIKSTGEVYFKAKTTEGGEQ